MSTHTLKMRARHVGAALSLMALSGYATADVITDMVTGGKGSGQLRLRYEKVQQEGNANAADATTLRTQVGFTFADVYGVGGMVQLEDVHSFGSDNYNSTINGLTTLPLIVDPEAAEVNQAYASYKGFNTVVKYGRQVIVYDNQRFIGDVGWRQNQQTWDGFTFVNQYLPGTTFSYAYVTNANTIFSQLNAARGDIEMTSNFLNVAYKGFKPLAVVGYGYFIDYDTGQFFPPTASHSDMGLRLDGSAGEELKWLYTAEYAKQSDYKGGTSSGAGAIDADYLFGMFGIGVKGVQVKLNYELLSGNGTYAFQTPFATLHAMNGWADKFLVIPADGLEDTFLSVGGAPFLGVNFMVMYHLFKSDNLGFDYGDELDVSVGRKFGKVGLLLKYADYSGDKNTLNTTRNAAQAPQNNVTKYWAQAEILF
jgi:hypothetical protein